jgi:hypothetical protein
LGAIANERLLQILISTTAAVAAVPRPFVGEVHRRQSRRSCGIVLIFGEGDDPLPARISSGIDHVRQREFISFLGSAPPPLLLARLVAYADHWYFVASTVYWA